MTDTKQDVYTRITSKIIASLEQGVRPWIQPWNAEHAAGKLTRPLRHNGQAYSGINILMVRASAMEQGFAAPIWMTFKQVLELGAHVRKGEKGSFVVYANAITRTEQNDAGEDVEREIPLLKGYTVFNADQIEGLPSLYYAKAECKLTPVERIARAEEFFAATRERCIEALGVPERLDGRHLDAIGTSGVVVLVAAVIDDGLAWPMKDRDRDDDPDMILSQTFNAYHYALNNPTGVIDPGGQDDQNQNPIINVTLTFDYFDWQFEQNQLFFATLNMSADASSVGGPMQQLGLAESLQSDQPSLATVGPEAQATGAVFSQASAAVFVPGSGLNGFGNFVGGTLSLWVQGPLTTLRFKPFSW